MLKPMFAVTGLVLLTMGVAKADGPGPWSQYDDMVNHKTYVRSVPVQPSQPAQEANFFANSQKQGTWLFQANQNEGSNN